MGDPAGIGPEIIAKALLNPEINNLATFQIIGDYQIFSKYQKKPIKNCLFLDLKNIHTKKLAFGKMSKMAGEAAIAYLDTALSLLKTKKLSALVTAPVCKEAVQLNNPKFKGHTEYLAQAFGVKDFDMMFVLDNLKVVIATRHIPLSEVAQQINPQLIQKTIRLTMQSLTQHFRLKNPKIAICGLNPHAGEGGHIGHEEIDIIVPAIQRIKKLYKNVSGPFAADTLFCDFNAAKYDAIIAMYHDQGLVPIKTTNFYKLVNLTIGLPIIRTSPAHGTAFDIVGKNKADPSSMCESIKLAVRLAR
ncbi:MAG: 4-hydroxythreonine-4-phosphate dehydrogenase PdxA [Candidatus Omnitrophica bacterium]|nr:4-hydroxythreonine-4-phosphate dehydrogenase PdxA [Candidatus Omnitrophota bacterium]